MTPAAIHNLYRRVEEEMGGIILANQIEAVTETITRLHRMNVPVTREEVLDAIWHIEAMGGT